MNEKLHGAEPPLLGDRYGRLGRFHTYVTGERATARAAILEIVEASPVIDVPCLCGATDEDQLLAGIDRWGLPCRQILCNACGLIRSSPRWLDETFSTIYAKHFWPLQSGSREISSNRFQLSLERSKPFYQRLQQLPLKDKNVCEIGCSYGAGLFHVKSDTKRIVGYDWDTSILKIGKEMTGLDLRHGGVEAAVADNPQGYDIVILRHVVEHFLSPLKEIQNLHRLLAPGARLVIEVPGVFNSSEFSPDPLGFFNAFHTFSFSLKTLTELMHRCGFRCVYGDEIVFSIWEASTSPPKANPQNGREEAAKILAALRQYEKRRQFDQSVLGKAWQRIRKTFRVG